MPEAVAGTPVTGSGIVYTVPRDHRLRLETLTFTLTCSGAAGVHQPKVSIYDTTLNAYTARLTDWNEAPASAVIYYTFAIGLRPFNCTLTTGMGVQHDLPDTILEPDTLVYVASVDDTGATWGSDTITSVVLYGTFFDTVSATTASAEAPGPLLVPVAA